MVIAELRTQGASNHSTYLKKIAEVLNCSVGDLIDDGKSLQHSGQIELLRLWSLLTDDAARLRLLEVARLLADAEAKAQP